MTVAEEGGANISPKAFRNLILPCMHEIFESSRIPRVVLLFGRPETVVQFALTCAPDGVILEKGFGIEEIRGRLPESIPLFGECGAHDMLSTATPAEIARIVNRHLDMGFTTVSPPADIYPPAKIENIEAFVKALRAKD